ncbi:hypothetical protein FHW12_001423 [Dokdonella fugitiva]|uniref:Thioredoxin domain-containing protein n=1 Tax=Dokdonella fugitiva TaxID=328517 RepID=A0A839EZX4_9GAMM|nr:hypothetical protein [Dokdonella fugitiva]MBA8887209.1 hypothetical protein [Dokdonella fugitiva]
MKKRIMPAHVIRRIELSLPRPTWLVLQLLALLMATAAATATASDRVADALTALRRTDRDIVETRAKVTALAQRFEPLLAFVDRTGVGRLTDEDVRGFDEAAAILSFYTNERRYTKVMRRAYDELARRKLVTPKDRRDMLAYYVAARMLADAHAFIDLPGNADLPAPPRERDERGAAAAASVWRVEDDGASVVRRDVAVGGGAQVVIVGSPWCGFSRKAVAAIEADPVLAERVRAHATWVIPQGIVPGFGEIAAWNRDHPVARMALVYAREEWPQIPTWETPGFYVLRDGALAASLLGWPDDAQADRLRALLASTDADVPASGDTSRAHESP